MKTRSLHFNKGGVRQHRKLI